MVHQIPICFCRPFHTNLVAMSFFVVRMEGCDRPWIKSKTWHLQLAGTIGLAWPVDISHRSVTPLGSKRNVFELETRRCSTIGLYFGVLLLGPGHGMVINPISNIGGGS